VTGLSEQELVVHLYAPTDGPSAQRAAAQVGDVWQRARSLLGLVEPVLQLPTELPADLTAAAGGDPDGTTVLAAAQDLAANYQIIARRHHDLVLVSMVFAAPIAAALGPVLAPSWTRFTRWWRDIAANGTDALLSTVRVYQAVTEDQLTTDGVAADVRQALPVLAADPAWWLRGRRTGPDFVEFDVASRSARADRAVVVVAPAGRADELSAYTWSRGDTALPPLGRYLFHAARIRYQARVLADADLPGRRRGVLDLLDRRPADHSVLRTALVANARVQADLTDMRRGVAIAAENLSASGVETFPEDERLAVWLRKRLSDELDATATIDVRLRAVLGTDVGVPIDPGTPTEVVGLLEPRWPGSAIRVGFAVDVKDYSLRPAPQKLEAQQRVAAMIDGVLEDMDVQAGLVDPQKVGDGAMVFLPPVVTPERALAVLLASWPRRLGEDNRRCLDRLRIRLAAAIGPAVVAPLGWGNNTPVELGRLVNCAAVRDALINCPDADLAVLISDPLYVFTVDQGYPEFERYRFESRAVDEKTYHRSAWLCVPDH
jgi:hypothetical protein